MYFPFSELRKWSKRQLRLADAIVRCCLRENNNIHIRAACPAVTGEKVGVSLRGVRVFHNEKHHLLISGKIVPDALFDVVHLPFFHHDRRNLSESVSDAVRDIERTLPSSRTNSSSVSLCRSR